MSNCLLLMLRHSSHTLTLSTLNLVLILLPLLFHTVLNPAIAADAFCISLLQSLSQYFHDALHFTQQLHQALYADQ